MSTISASTTTTTAYKVTADTTGTLAFQTGSTPTTYMTLDASGNLGVGTSSPNLFSRPSGLSVGISSANNAFLQINAATGNQAEIDLGVNAVRQASIYSDASTFSLIANTNIPMVFGTNNSERARIDSSGNLLVGTASTPSSSVAGLRLKNTASGDNICSAGSSTSAWNQFTFINGNGTVGVIQTTGSSCNFTNLSDARVKNDLGVAVDTSIIDNTVVHDFTWKIDGVQSRGVFAQEAYEVKPDAVLVGNDEITEEGKLANPWGVDYSKYVPDLIVHAQQLKKQVQEQQAIITTLTARIEALENK